MADYVIFTKDDCIYCKRAKELLDILGEEYEEINILEGDNRAKLNEKLGYEARTVPQIWHGGAYVGGYDTLVKYTKD